MTRKPPTSPTDPRNHICRRCGRQWRKNSGKTACPYCGYSGGRVSMEAPAP